MYNGDDIPDIHSAKGKITINGNLQLNIDCQNHANRNDTRAINNLLNNNDSFEINGDTKIPINNVKTTAYTYYVEGIRAFSGTMKYNDKFTIDKIDAGKNSGNPHLFIGELEGPHALRLNNIGNTTDGAGNVLASVASGEGIFTAPALEGSLYWTTYELGM